MYITYILISKQDGKTYVGFTNDLTQRLAQHNKGHHKYTKRHRPWSVLYSENYKSRAEAYKRERYYKSAAGRRALRKKYSEIV